MIVDHRGQPLKSKKVLQEEIAGASLSEGRYIYPTREAREFTPSRLGKLLREAETPGYGASHAYLELAERMEEMDLHYLGELQTRRRQLVQIGVDIEPATDSAEDQADADLVAEFFKRDTIEDELYDLLDAIAKGFSVAEIIWDTSESQWMPQRLAWRLPQWFDFDYVTGERLMMRNITSSATTPTGDSQIGDLAGGGYQELPPFKFVTHIVKAKSGIAIRGGLARCAAWAWMFKYYGQQDWARFAESYGQPLRLGKYPPGAQADDLNVLYRAVRMVSTDAAAILPESMNIEFPDVSDVAGRSEIYKDLVGYMDRQVSIAVLGQTLTTSEGASGSYSLGQVHNLVRHDIEQSDGRQLASSLRRDLVIPIVKLNRGERKTYPRVVIEREIPEDRKLLAESLQMLIPSGLRVKADEVRQKLGLSKPEDEDEVLSPPDSTAMARALGLAVAQRNGGARDPVAEAIARELGDWRPLVDPVTEPIIAMAKQTLDAGGDLAGFRAHLPDVVHQMDDEAVVTLLHRLLFSAQMSGSADDS